MQIMLFRFVTLSCRICVAITCQFSKLFVRMVVDQLAGLCRRADVWRFLLVVSASLDMQSRIVLYREQRWNCQVIMIFTFLRQYLFRVWLLLLHYCLITRNAYYYHKMYIVDWCIWPCYLVVRSVPHPPLCDKRDILFLLHILTTSSSSWRYSKSRKGVARGGSGRWWCGGDAIIFFLTNAPHSYSCQCVFKYISSPCFGAWCS